MLKIVRNYENEKCNIYDKYKKYVIWKKLLLYIYIYIYIIVIKSKIFTLS